jgi:hypothetical protein
MCHISFLLSSSNEDEINFLVYTIISFVPMPYPTRMRTCGLLQLGAYIFQITFSVIQSALILQFKPNAEDTHTFKISHCINVLVLTAVTLWI